MFILFLSLLVLGTVVVCCDFAGWNSKDEGLLLSVIATTVILAIVMIVFGAICTNAKGNFSANVACGPGGFGGGVVMIVCGSLWICLMFFVLLFGLWH